MTTSRSSPPTTRGPAMRSGHEPRRGQQLDDAVRLGERPRTEIVTAGSGKVRSYDLDGKLLWELAGMSTIHIPTPFATQRTAVHQLGLPGRSFRPVYAIRPGASGDISLKKDETTNEFIAWSHPTLGAQQSVAARLRRLLLHAPRSRPAHLPRRQDRQGDLPAAADHDGRRRFTASLWACRSLRPRAVSSRATYSPTTGRV